jgi:hypothetical protein
MSEQSIRTKADNIDAYIQAIHMCISGVVSGK